MQQIELTHPVVSYKGRQACKNTCKGCKKPFWHFKPKTYCGDSDCNRTYKEELFSPLEEYDLKKTQSKLSYFLNPTSFYPKAFFVKRAPLVVVYPSTAMNFLCAGCIAYESLIDQKNPRHLYFDSALLVSNHFCYRFYDTKNINLTKRHCSGFFMIGLHCFEGVEGSFLPSWKDDWFNHILGWFTQTLNIPLESIYVHPGTWSDGVNSGISMEFFINGTQISNIVYTTQALNQPRVLRYLDVGIGAQRLTNLLSKTKHPYFTDLLKDHLRSILMGLRDGILPTKIGVGYNLRKLIEAIFINNLYDKEVLKVEVKRICLELFDLTEDSGFLELEAKTFRVFEKEYDRCVKSKIV